MLNFSNSFLFKISLFNILAFTVNFYHVDLFYFFFDFLLFSFVITLLYVRIRSKNTFAEPKLYESPIEYVSVDVLRSKLSLLLRFIERSNKFLIQSTIYQKMMVCFLILR